ncbi:MAG: hypothetical protein V1645_00795 [archaeon]
MQTIEDYLKQKYEYVKGKTAKTIAEQMAQEIFLKTPKQEEKKYESILDRMSRETPPTETKLVRIGGRKYTTKQAWQLLRGIVMRDVGEIAHNLEKKASEYLNRKTSP